LISGIGFLIFQVLNSCIVICSCIDPTHIVSYVLI
jgi:hypothetical protein